MAPYDPFADLMEGTAATEQQSPYDPFADLFNEEEQKKPYDPFAELAEDQGYGYRADGTRKGKGFLGELQMQDGSDRVATEISIGVEFDGKETEIPTLVPTLDEEQRNYLLQGGDPRERDDIVQAAVDHAMGRINEGKPVFFEEEQPVSYDPFAQLIDQGAAGAEQAQAPLFSSVKVAKQRRLPQEKVSTLYGSAMYRPGEKSKLYEFSKIIPASIEYFSQALPRGIWGQTGAMIAGIGKSRIQSQTVLPVRAYAEEVYDIDQHLNMVKEGKAGLTKYQHYNTPERIELLKARRDEYADKLEQQYALKPEEVNSPKEIREAVERVRKYSQKSIKEKLKDSAWGTVSEVMRDQADWWRELQDERQEAWNIDPMVNNSTAGQFLRSVGMAPGFIGLTFLGPFGFGLMENIMYSFVEEEAIEEARKRGKEFVPEDHIAEMAVSAVGQAALERMFGFERVADSILREIGKAGKMSFKEFAKQMAVRTQAAGLEEAATEPTQGIWNDLLASISYDEGREILSGDALKRRMFETFSGYGLGVLMAGGFTTTAYGPYVERGYVAPMGFVNPGKEQGPELDFAGFYRDEDGNPVVDTEGTLVPLFKMKTDFPEMGISNAGEIISLQELAQSDYQFAIPQIPEVDFETEQELNEQEKKFAGRIAEILEVTKSGTELTDDLEADKIEETVETFVDPNEPITEVERLTPLNKRPEYAILDTEEEAPQLDFVSPTEEEAAEAIDRLIAESIDSMQQEYEDYVKKKDPEADPITWQFNEQEIRLLEWELRQRLNREQGIKATEAEQDLITNQTLGFIQEQGYQDSITDRGTIWVWHGTSAENVQGIESQGSFKGYPFFALDEETAQRFARQAGGRSQLMRVEVDVNSILPTGGYLTTRQEGLVRDKNGIWRAKPQETATKKPLYHGTVYAFESPDTTEVFWLTDNRKMADTYRKRSVVTKEATDKNIDIEDPNLFESDMAMEELAKQEGIDTTQGRIVEYHLSKGKELDLTSLPTNVANIEQLGEVWNILYEQGLVDQSWESFDDAIKAEIETEYLMDQDGRTPVAIWRILEGEGVYQKAREQGFDYIKINDVGTDGNEHLSYGVINPDALMEPTVSKPTEFKQIDFVLPTEAEAMASVEQIIAETVPKIRKDYRTASKKRNPNADPVTWELSESDIKMLENELRRRLAEKAEEESEAWKQMTPQERKIRRLNEMVMRERTKYDERLAEAKRKFEEKLTAKQDKFDERLNKAAERYRQRIEKLKTDSKEKLARARERMKEALAKKDEQIVAIKLRHEQKYEQQKARAAAKLANEVKKRTNLMIKKARERQNLVSVIADLETLLKELPASVQKKFVGYKKITKNIGEEALQRAFNERVERLNQLMEEYTIKQNRDNLYKLIKKVRKNKKKPKELAVFDRIKKYAEMELTEALNKAEALSNPPARPDGSVPQVTPEAVEEAFLLKIFGGKLNSENRGDFSGEEMRLARQEAEYILREGKTRVKERAARDAARKEELRNKAKEIILQGEKLLGTEFLEDREGNRTTIKKMLSELDKYANKRHDSLEMLLDSLDSTPGRFTGFLHDTFSSRVFRARIRANRRNSIAINKFGAVMERVLQLNGVKGGKKALLDTANAWEEKSTGHGIIYNHQGTNDEPVPLSKWQAITMYMQWQDKTLAPTFEKMEITEDTMEKVEKYIGEDGKMVANFLLNEYKKYGAELRQVVADNDNYIIEILDNYSPITRYVDGKPEQTTTEMLNMKDYRGQSVKNRSMIERTKNTNELHFKGANDVFKQHAYQMNHYFEFAAVAKDIGAVFSNAEVRRAIRQRTGSNDMNMLLDDMIGDILNNGMRRAQMDDMIAKFVRGTTVGSLALRVPVFFKQLGSAPGYMAAMPAKEWFKYERQYWKNPIENSKTLIALDYIQDRISNSYDRELRQIADRGTNRGISNIRTKRDKWMFMTRYGDLGAILAGGWPLYQYTYDQTYAQAKADKKSDAEADALAKAKAERIFSEVTARQQQDSNIFSLGYWQRGDGLQKLFTQYMTTPIQYHRNVANALRAYKNGRIGFGEMAKTAFIFHVLLPQIYTAIGSAFIGFWGDDDDAVEEFWRRQGNALLIGNLNSLFIVGDFIEGLVNAIGDKEKQWMIDTNIPALDTFEEGFKGLAKYFNAGDDDERWEGVDQVLENVFRAAGVPYGQVMDFFKAVEEVSEEETEYPLLRLMGWSDYQIPGDEEND